MTTIAHTALSLHPQKGAIASGSKPSSAPSRDIFLSRSTKENHGEPFVRVSKPPAAMPFANLVASLTHKQVNIYDTDALLQGYMDVLLHFAAIPESEVFSECCWLWDDADGKLAVVCEDAQSELSSSIYLISITFGAVVAKLDIGFPTKLTYLMADSEDPGRFLALDSDAALHAFSFGLEDGYEGRLGGSVRWIVESNGIILQVPDGEPNSLLVHDPGNYAHHVSAFKTQKRIEYASLKDNDLLVIDQDGAVFLNQDLAFTVPAAIWSEKILVDFDGSDLLAVLLESGTVHIFSLTDPTRARLSAELSRGAVQLTSFDFILEANCCREGTVPRFLTTDTTGTINIYRISRE